MIEHAFDEARSIVVVRPRSRFSKDDFAELAQAVDPKIEAAGRLAGVVVEVASFPGWDSFGALVAHFRFVRSHHKQVRKIAVVTDSAFGKIAERVMPHVVSPEFKRFPAGQVEAAEQWIAG
ncbi:MAG: STAS/SEC14 domain-containing protein [Segniliparus sp.]|uniref:STAS/SEC14 domain-containing protein n=1 Tax=Segniliparus sp. TaxID=2804064 RepID=UPI003F2A664A